jgi:endonuclease G, mitochondrial
MNQPEGEPSTTTGPARSHELNGTFLVRPAQASNDQDSIRGLAEAIVFQVHGGPGADGGAWARLELMLDGANLLPFHYLRTGDRLGRAVVKIQRDDGSTGTGFLVASDILLTNHHVLPDHMTAMASVAMANYEVSPPNDAAGRTAVSQIDPASLFVTNADLDFTFCGVQGLDFLGAIPLDRERMHAEVDQTVTIIQHPRGRPKEIALRENRVVHADGVVIQYSCDTEPGSSGSPVFNAIVSGIS